MLFSPSPKASEPTRPRGAQADTREQESSPARHGTTDFGNRALMRMPLRASPLRPSRTPLLQRQCACGSTCPSCTNDGPKLQTKLAINEPGDVFEQEADRLADQVMRMPALQAKAEDGAGSQARTNNTGPPAGIPPAVGKVLRSPGQPLDSATRAFMEPRFGQSFADVRIHNGSQADTAAASVQARAFTLGRDVVFAAGEHDPGSEGGKRLLAHELTHVVQQSQHGVPRRIQRTITVKNPTAIKPPHTKNNGAVVVDLFDKLCSDTSWQLVSGEIVLATADFCATAAAKSTTRVSCECACKFTSKAGPHVSIEIDPDHDDTQFTSTGAANSFDIRLRGVAASSIRGVTGAPVAAGDNSLRTLADPPWLILGHELCGHALTSLPNIATPGRPVSVEHESTAGSDQSAVDIENRIRREHSSSGADLGTRAGDFDDVEGNLHYGAIVQLPSAMTLKALLSTLGVPAGTHKPRCPVPNWYLLCGSTEPIESIPILDRVVYRQDGKLNVAENCLTRSFAAGDFFGIEGVFWHLADGVQTKTAIASRWGITVATLDQANKVFAPTVAALAPTDPVSANSSVIIPYRAAAGTTRFFFTAATGPC
jgi:hypothetical protein